MDLAHDSRVQERPDRAALVHRAIAVCHLPMMVLRSNHPDKLQGQFVAVAPGETMGIIGGDMATPPVTRAVENLDGQMPVAGA